MIIEVNITDLPAARCPKRDTWISTILSLVWSDLHKLESHKRVGDAGPMTPERHQNQRRRPSASQRPRAVL